MKPLFILLTLSLFMLANTMIDILSFGAIPNSDTIEDQFKNSKALK